MKILILCPGSWSHGLDSPERGESRWAQNLARLLGKMGHEVVAASSGSPKEGAGRPAPRVTLTTNNRAKEHEPFDMYFDSSWWRKKRPVAKARAYFHVHWSLEEHLRGPEFPKNHYIIYPYNDSEPNFIHPANHNLDRTFFLPTPFCRKLAEPAFDKTEFLWPSRDAFTAPFREKNSGHVIDIVNQYLTADPHLSVTWMFEQALMDSPFFPNVRQGHPRDHFLPISPYNKILEAISRAKLALPINLPSCILDCAVAGVPSLIWQRGSFFQDVAEKHGLLIESVPPWGENPLRIKEVIDVLMTDKEVYTAYTKDLQHRMRHHTETEVMKCFNHIISKI